MRYRIILCLAVALSACSKDDPDTDGDPPTDEDSDVPLYTADLVGRTLQIEGSAADSSLALRLQLGAPVILEVDIGDDAIAEHRFDITQFDAIVINANGGADVVRIDEANGVFTVSEPTIINGGGGNDTLIGGSGPETLSGGDGDDSVIGGIGVDIVNLGSGNDTFFWSAGHGGDVIDGGDGDETLSFTGSEDAETITLSASGERLLVAWNGSSVDAGSVEQVTLEPLGGADSITVGDLSAIALGRMNIDLRAAAGSTGDGQADTITLNGAAGQDTVSVSTEAGRTVVDAPSSEVAVKGYEAGDLIVLAATGNDLITVSGTEGADQLTVTANGALVRLAGAIYSASVDISGYVPADTLTINCLGGADEISAAANLAALVKLQIDGGEGDDVLLGGNGADTLLGGPGNDRVDSNQGNDTVFLGEGNDVAQWDPGDGSDTIEGQGGTDTLEFNGSAGAEIIALSANGARALFTRNVGNIIMDLDDVEQVTVHIFGGADTLTLNDMSGTDVAQFTVDLAGPGTTTGDAAVDTVTINGTANADTIQVSTSAGAVLVDGLFTSVDILAADATDGLTLNGLAGTDTFNVDAAVNALITVTSNQ
ncbi:MAG: hypothetical protein ACAI38_13415 [Myxococcota bacterium]